MAGFFSFPGWAIPLARRALYAWVRTTVFPETPAALALDPDKPVCYVLQDHPFSNRLVLFEETQRAGLPPAQSAFRIGGQHFPHAAFFLNRGFSLARTARERFAHPPLMRALVRAALAPEGPDVQIVPVVILWGRRPEHQESILKALFSETWRQPGPLPRLLTILLHGRTVLVRFNAPISLRSISHAGLDEEKALRKLSRVLRVHFRRQREMAIGPDLSHRNTQIETLLAAPAVREAVVVEAGRKNLTPSEAEERARRFALEVASDYSYGVMRAFELFLSWLWPRLYDGIELYRVDTVTQIAPGNSIVYVPTHRSHVDYLLLSYFLHHKGLTPPHIAAGANLNMPVVGPLLRRCGAFFLRRSFKGEALYAAVFHEYLHLMLTRGFPIEYFIEGGRSRSGRTLTPKAGILGMTVSSFIREHPRPLVFVPVYIGYERVMEGRTYLRELAGTPKQGESLWGVLQSVRQIKRIFGTVHINFGEPLPLADFLEGQRPGWQSENFEDAVNWSRDATRAAATELAVRLNAAAVINPVNLIALALLATPQYTADEQTLCRVLEHYRALAAGAPYAAATVACPLPAGEIVAKAIRLGLAERVGHPLGDLIRLMPAEAPLLGYFRNNVLHVFALPAIIACLFNNRRELAGERIAEAVSGIYGLMRAELFLRLADADLPAASAAAVDVLVERRLLQRRDDGSLCAAEPTSQDSFELRLLGEPLRPILERQFLTLAVLQHAGSGTRSRQSLANECHLLGQRLSLLYATSQGDASEVKTYQSFFAQLIDAELVREDDQGLLCFDERLTEPLALAELVLPAEAREAIRRLAASSPPAGGASKT